MKSRLAGKARALATTLIVGLVVATGVAFAPAATAGTDDYPSQWRNAPQDSVVDQWGEYNRECTSFVAWRLHARNGYEMDFHADATQWRQRAQAEGVRVDTTPAVGAVAWWSFGHVAWVEAVSGGNVTVEDYNYGLTGQYAERTISAGSPTNYLHFKDLVGGGGSGQGDGVGGAHYFGKNHLDPGDVLSPNQYIASSDLEFALILQNDGNLVLYGGGYRPIWATNTGGRSVRDAAMQSDGNLVLYGPGGSVVWASNTGGSGPSHLQLQDDGNAVLYKNAGGVSWATNTGGHNTFTYDGSGLPAGSILYPGHFLRSPDDRYALLLQGDGNLVLFGPGYHVLWASNTGGYPTKDATAQTDGDFVLYSRDGGAVWSTFTGGRGSSHLVVQSDGNVVLYKDDGGGAIWATYTTGRI
ncbi:CHAP domain-containing protein [Actinoallomurus iriomotensis]|uniref:CHAP domain-containing protein n=1 Tax=Actinoallomurus iriomotensis TaxID=478107 RepID=A0A9W6S0C6_9ACTN|nr:CHAP domain-containing protein [Actinoallomurus iriomotensis]GLY86141.1 hypothetical protein Airi02_040700 [Actinoallomurus iriomotensis]